MRLLIIVSLKEYQEDVARHLTQAGITEFFVNETSGFRDDKNVNLLDGWFGMSKEPFDSVFIYSFTDEDKLEKAKASIKEYNTRNDEQEPVKMFVIPVDMID